MPDYISNACTYSVTDQTTTSSYVDLGSAFNVHGYKEIHISITNSGGSNSGTFKLLGSIDGTTYDVTVITDTPLATSTTKQYFIGKPYVTIKFQVKDTSGGNHTTINCKVLARK